MLEVVVSKISGGVLGAYLTSIGKWSHVNTSAHLILSMLVDILAHLSTLYFLILLYLLLNRSPSPFVFIAMRWRLLPIALIVVVGKLRFYQVHLWPKLSCLLHLGIHVCRVGTSYGFRILILPIPHLLLLMMHWEVNFRARFVVVKRANVLLRVLRVVFAGWSVILTRRAKGCIVHVTILYVRSLQRR